MVIDQSNREIISSEAHDSNAGVNNLSCGCPTKRRFWTTRAGIDNFAQARQHMVQNGENVVFDFGDERLIVEHTKIGQLYDDMIFG